MNVRECYEKIGGDYLSVLQRLRSEELIKRVAVKFLDDPSFDELIEAYRKQDPEEAFLAAHSLKGVCANLGFDRLYKSVFDLVEKLRKRSLEGTQECLEAVKREYEFTSEVLKELKGC